MAESSAAAGEAAAELAATEAAAELIAAPAAAAGVADVLERDVPEALGFVAAALLLQAANERAAATVAKVLVTGFRRRRVVDTFFLHVGNVDGLMGSAKGMFEALT